MSMSKGASDHDTGGLRILVPVDGSRQSAKVAEFAGRLPASEIVILHVATNREAGSPDFDARLEAVAAPLRSDRRTVGTEVRTGDVAGEILDAAAGFDLIVMATHGRGAAGRFLFGSVADRISSHSTTPTLLVRAGTAETESPSTARVMVPLDGSDLAELALPIASTIASRMSLPLHLLRSVGLDDVRSTIGEQTKSGNSGTDADQTYDDAREETERRASAYLERVAERMREGGVETHTDLLEGTAAFALLWEIGANDLVVMTSHGVHGFRRWLLGSVAEKLVRESKAPVLLVPTRGRLV